jgi:elongation factor Ts
MEITAKMVKELRDKTGAGMMDCKGALGEAGGDMEKAVKILREKGIAKAAKKVGRETSEGAVVAYIHPGDKLGVLVEVACETDFVARTDQFKAFARDVAMHIAASSPVCVRREREIFRKMAEKEGKPEKIIDKIVDGKIEKFYSESVLLEQPYVKDTDKSVKQYLDETVGSLGENIMIKRFTRFRLGE